MAALGKIVLVGLVVLLLACVLSPPVYWLAQWAAGHGILAPLAEFPFHRYFSRILQVCAIVAVVPLLLWLGVWRLSELGIERNARALPDVGVGVLAALIPAAVLGWIYVSTEMYRLRSGIEIGQLGRILLTAGFVACIEEFLFRGVLLGLAVRAFGALKGAVVVSLVFAVAHFLRPAKTAVESVTWMSGFQQAGQVFGGAPEMPVLAYGFASLLAVGLILAWVTVRTKSLWLAIGLHAGWILGQQGLNWLARYRVKPPDAALPWVGPNVVSGVVPTGILPLLALAVSGAALVVYFWIWRRGAAR